MSLLLMIRKLSDNSIRRTWSNVAGFEGGEWGHEPGMQTATATAKSLQSCPTLCDPTDGPLEAGKSKEMDFLLGRLE